MKNETTTMSGVTVWNEYYADKNDTLYRCCRYSDNGIVGSRISHWERFVIWKDQTRWETHYSTMDENKLTPISYDEAESIIFAENL